MKVSIFCPSTFNDFPFLESILDPKVDELEMIISNGSGNRLPEKYAQERGIPNLIYPVSGKSNIFTSNDMVVKNGEFALIIDNGKSSNIENILKSCKVQEKKYKIFTVDPPVAIDAKIKRNINRLAKIVEECEDNPIMSAEDAIGFWGEEIIKIVKKIYE